MIWLYDKLFRRHREKNTRIWSLPLRGWESRWETRPAAQETRIELGTSLSSVFGAAEVIVSLWSFFLLPLSSTLPSSPPVRTHQALLPSGFWLSSADEEIRGREEREVSSPPLTLSQPLLTDSGPWPFRPRAVMLPAAPNLGQGAAVTCSGIGKQALC